MIFDEQDPVLLLVSLIVKYCLGLQLEQFKFVPLRHVLQALWQDEQNGLVGLIVGPEVFMSKY